MCPVRQETGVQTNIEITTKGIILKWPVTVTVRVWWMTVIMIKRVDRTATPTTVFWRQFSITLVCAHYQVCRETWKLRRTSSVGWWCGESERVGGGRGRVIKDDQAQHKAVVAKDRVSITRRIYVEVTNWVASIDRRGGLPRPETLDTESDLRSAIPLMFIYCLQYVPLA